MCHLPAVSIIEIVYNNFYFTAEQIKQNIIYSNSRRVGLALGRLLG